MGNNPEITHSKFVLSFFSQDIWSEIYGSVEKYIAKFLNKGNAKHGVSPCLKI